MGCMELLLAGKWENGSDEGWGVTRFGPVGVLAKCKFIFIAEGKTALVMGNRFRRRPLTTIYGFYGTTGQVGY